MKDSNFIHSTILVIMLLSATSCVSIQNVVNNENYLGDTNSDLVYSQVEPGDYVTIKANDRIYRNLRVISVNDSYLTVEYITGDYRKIEHRVNSDYIQSLSIVKTEITYPIGGPFTIVLIIMFLLV